MFMQAANRCKYLLALATLLSVLSAQSGFAQSTIFTYQGRLTDAGNPASGNFDLQFKLFDTPSVGTGTQQGATITRNAVAVSAGAFTVTLDFGASVFGGADRFLEIGVRPAGGGAFTTLNPRQPVTSTPYAIQTLNAQQLGGLPASGFVQNTTTPQAGANLNLGGNATMGSLNVNGPASFGGVAAPAVAPAGQGRIYFDAATNKLKLSENGGAFVNLVGTTGVGGSGTANTIPLWSGGTTLGNSVITQSAGSIGIGTTNPTLGKLQVESSTGTGVYGLTSFNTSVAGVYGKSSVLHGRGVIGEANGNAAFGVWGNTDSGYGVRGTSGGSGTGVYGSSSNWRGVEGFSSSGSGVFGYSGSGAAVIGNGTSFFLGDTHPLPSGYGKGVAIGFNQNTTVGYVFAYDYSTSQAQSLALNQLGGNVGIGTSTPQRLLHVNGRVRFSAIPSEAGITDHVCTNVFGDLLACGTSSLRYKQNVQTYRHGLDIVRRLRPISFDWKNGSGHDIGLGAEEVARVAPALTFTDNQGEIAGVKYERLNMLLINAIKEQQKLIEQLQARLARLERAVRRRGVVRQPIKMTTADSRK